MISMKIAMVTPSYYPIIGGTESTVQLLASNLNERGINTDVITLNMNKLWKPLRRWKVEKINGIDIIRIPALKSHFGLLPIRVIPLVNLARILRDYDIIHYHDEEDLSLPIFSYFVKKPKILHCHSLSGTHDYLKSNILCKCLLLGLVGHYICNSNESFELLLDLGISGERISVVNNPVNLEDFSNVTYANDPYECARGLDVDQNTKKIVYVGRLDKDKLIAVTSTVKAISKIIREILNVQLILVGDGECFDFIKMLAERINKKEDRQLVVLTGAIRGEANMAKILKIADAVIGIGRVAIEAMACGKPVIVADDTLGPLSGNFGGIVTKENVDQLKYYNFSGRNGSERTTPDRIAEAVIELLTDDKHRQSIGDFGRYFVKKEYDVQKIAKQIEAIYYSFF